MKFKPNQRGIDALFKQVADKIEAIDKDLRGQYTGEPVDAIVGPASAAFNAAGLQTDPNKIREYAQSISDDKPFTIDLK